MAAGAGSDRPRRPRRLVAGVRRPRTAAARRGRAARTAAAAPRARRWPRRQPPRTTAGRRRRRRGVVPPAATPVRRRRDGRSRSRPRGGDAPAATRGRHGRRTTLPRPPRHARPAAAARPVPQRRGRGFPPTGPHGGGPCRPRQVVVGGGGGGSRRAAVPPTAEHATARRGRRGWPAAAVATGRGVGAAGAVGRAARVGGDPPRADRRAAAATATAAAAGLRGRRRGWRSACTHGVGKDGRTPVPAAARRRHHRRTGKGGGGGVALVSPCPTRTTWTSSTRRAPWLALPLPRPPRVSRTRRGNAQPDAPVEHNPPAAWTAPAVPLHSHGPRRHGGVVMVSRALEHGAPPRCRAGCAPATFGRNPCLCSIHATRQGGRPKPPQPRLLRAKGEKGPPVVVHANRQSPESDTGAPLHSRFTPMPRSSSLLAVRVRVTPPPLVGQCDGVTTGTD